MIKITNSHLGFALWIASELARYLENCNDTYSEGMLNRDDLEVAEYFSPIIASEELEEANLEVAKLIYFAQDPSDADAAFLEGLDTAPFLKYLNILCQLAREGKINQVTAAQTALWRLPEDHDIYVGCLLDPEYLLEFYERMSKTKRPIAWQEGHFLVVVDCDELDEEWWRQA